MRRLALAALAVCALAAAPARAVDLIGTWYVLIHYKDSSSENAEIERWDDRVWVFEKQGPNLRWTEYPIVVFDDETGRFERRSTGQYARLLHYWEPSDVQLADIRDGLKVNTRGSKTKTLRGSEAKGWNSGARAAASSASVLTYTEIWQIESPASLPVFSRTDVMGGGNAEGLEGLTRYTTKEVRDGGALLVGDFVRDENRRGSFRMMRTAAVGSLEEKTQEQIQRQAAIRGLSEGAQSREEVRNQVRNGLAGYGLFLSDGDVEKLVTQGFDLAMKGVPVPEIQKRLGTNLLDTFWSLAPRGARHDDATRYRFPFDPSTPRKLYQGVGAEGRVGAESNSRFKEFEDAAHHSGWSRYAFKFWLPVGTPVLAARGGEVIRVIDGFSPREFEIQGNLNSVWVLHEDGTVGVYMHLGTGIPLRPGDRVKTGDKLGTSETPGYVKQPLLHFAVIRIDDDGKPQTVDIRFDDGTNAGLVPVEGREYPGG